MTWHCRWDEAGPRGFWSQVTSSNPQAVLRMQAGLGWVGGRLRIKRCH